MYCCNRSSPQSWLHSSVRETLLLSCYMIVTFYLFSDIKPDNVLIDKNGHLKLSDFGLSTGLHKASDGEYYKRFLEQEKTRDTARNSVQVNPINLTMSREQIATWKANRRKLVCSIFGSLCHSFSCSRCCRPIPPLAHLTMYENTYLTCMVFPNNSFMTDCPRGVFDERIRERM